MQLRHFVIVAFMGACTAAFAGGTALSAVSLEAVVAGPQRTAEQKMHDAYRHPVETLRFFGLKPDMTVIEVDPAAGWYAAIIAPYLKGEGRYYAALTPGSAEREAFLHEVSAMPEIYGSVHTIDLDPAHEASLLPDGGADMILSFHNVHDWMREGTAEATFSAFFETLRPGGILGIVEHRAADAGKQDPQALNGYVQQAHVVKLATEAGFRLVGQSEVNANPRDSKRHEPGEHPAGLVESDRMTLKFIKPGGVEKPDGRALKLKQSLDELQTGSN